MTHVFRFCFSTKYFDSELDLVYYGRRFQSFDMCCWIGRDTIEESGGENLYGYCRNNAMVCIDPLGEAIFIVQTDRAEASLIQDVNRNIKFAKIALRDIESMSNKDFVLLKQKGKILFNGRSYTGTKDDLTKIIKHETISGISVATAIGDIDPQMSKFAELMTESYDQLVFAGHGEISFSYDVVRSADKKKKNKKKYTAISFDGVQYRQSEVLSKVRKVATRLGKKVLIISCGQTWKGEGDFSRHRELYSSKSVQYKCVRESNKICFFSFSTPKVGKGSAR